MYLQSGEWVTILKDKIIQKGPFWKSFSFQIFVLLILVSSIPCFAIKETIIRRYEDRAVEWRTAEIQNQCTILCNKLGSMNYLEHPYSEVVNAELTQLSSVYDGRVLVVDQSYRVIKDSFGVGEGKTIVSPDVIACFRGAGTSHYDGKQRYMEITTPIVVTEDEKQIVKGVMLVSISTDVIADTATELSDKADMLFLVLMVVVAVAGAFYTSILARPIRRIASAIDDIAEGYENDNLQEDTYKETQEISDAFNKMRRRMKVLDDSRQEFVSNVSHELKTPLTSMKVLADSLLSQENVPVELYQEFMGDITEEIERENKIINDLLSLVKMDKTSTDINVKSENINELIERNLKRLRPIAELRNVEIVFESFRPVTADVDEVKFSLALSNLVENAIKYNKDNGWVQVSLNADYKYFYVKVSDSGIGIPEEELDHIFERFYRVDKSHSQEIDGTGLGLAITRNAVITHRGAIKVHSEEGAGTTFTVRIPLKYIA